MHGAKTDERVGTFLRDAFARMATIRVFEEACLQLSTQKDPLIAGSVHLCAGQEAVPVGTLAALRPDDQIVATYRGHGWAIACGLEIEKLFAEVAHKERGINGGRSGSAMIMAPPRFLGENSIVGAGAPIGCGAALAAKLEGTGRVVAVSFGDGATSQGALHEALVFAASRQLPVLFICENNGWSEMTALDSIVKVDRLARRANGYGFNGVTIDGTDPLIVRDTIAAAAASLRAGQGPAFIECRVPRLWGHYNRDIEHYRPSLDRSQAAERDPLPLLAARLVEAGVATRDELDAVILQAKADMQQLETALPDWELPSVVDAAKHVTAPIAMKGFAAEPEQPGSGRARQTIPYVQAVNEALRRELAMRPNVLVYGEDVGKAGGIFGASRYLQREFGADRVFDTPIAESAILGSAVGAAMCGMRPIVEIMWADFLLVALDQLINQAANVRYLTRGQSTVPLVVRTQQGATPGSCAQHSQSLEALLAHIPGLHVGLPSSPQDAYSMLRAAVANDDPCIIIEARSLYQEKDEVDFDLPVQTVGRARLRRKGKDITLLGWGAIIPRLIAAADELEKMDIQSTVLDLRWLRPLDTEALAAAIESTGGRVVIAHDATLTGGFGAEIFARIVETHGPEAKVRRLGGADTRLPASPILQAALLPSRHSIVEAARSVLDESNGVSPEARSNAEGIAENAVGH